MNINSSSHRITPSSLASAAVLAALVCAIAPSARAQGRQGGAVAQACAADVRTLCPGVQPGGGRILQCLAKNRAKVSDNCKQAAKAARAARSPSSGT